MRQGFTIVWSGWAPSASRDQRVLRLDVPVAVDGNGAIEQVVWDEVLVNRPGVTEAALSFPVARGDRERVTLVVRERHRDPPTLVPRDQWELPSC